MKYPSHSRLASTLTPSQDRPDSLSPIGARPLLRQSPQSNTGRTMTSLTERPIQSQDSLVVENVPVEALDNDVVRHFFSSFGPVSHVAVDPVARKALVSFTSSDHAKKALSCPNAIFGNRFVRIYRQRLTTSGIITSTPSAQVLPIASGSQSIFPSAPRTHTDIQYIPPVGKCENATDTRQQQLELIAKQMQSNAQEQTALLQSLDQSTSLSAKEKSGIMSVLRKLAVDIKLLRDSSKALTPSAAAVSSEPALQLALLRSEVSGLMCWLHHCVSRTKSLIIPGNIARHRYRSTNLIASGSPAELHSLSKKSQCDSSTSTG